MAPLSHTRVASPPFARISERSQQALLGLCVARSPGNRDMSASTTQHASQPHTLSPPPAIRVLSTTTKAPRVVCTPISGQVSSREWPGHLSLSQCSCAGPVHRAQLVSFTLPPSPPYTNPHLRRGIPLPLLDERARTMLHPKEDGEAEASLRACSCPTLLSPPYSPHRRPMLLLDEDEPSASTSGKHILDFICLLFWHRV